MLFSRDDVARTVNQNFEAVWVSVRAVPMVHIDFGNGKVITRTINGNIATYVCTADGQVLDIVAGIYEPATYIDRLMQMRLLANWVDQNGVWPRHTRLREYHERQLERLAKNEIPERFMNVAPITKAKIESGIKAVLVQDPPPPVKKPATVERIPGLEATTDGPLWKALLEDTQANETVRRKQVHELLAAVGLVNPETVTKKVYKDILHADLDDPYLGLGATLFANYPFKDDVKP